MSLLSHRTCSSTPMLAPSMKALPNSRHLSVRYPHCDALFFCKPTSDRIKSIMFILFGSPRSGTTLFKECLNLHSGIFIPNQTTFISPVAHVMSSVSEWEKSKKLVADLIVST